jgi:hypothetical protein
MLQGNHCGTSDISGKFFAYDKFYNYASVHTVLERPSSWSTSRIRPSCPRPRVRLSLLLDLFPQVCSCLL